MSVTLDELRIAVQSFFTRKLPGAVGDAPGDVLMVLDGLGTPLPPNDFGIGGSESQQQLLAHQRAAQLADQLPATNGLRNGWYLPRASSRLSLWYESAVSGSVCTSSGELAIAAFEARKANALGRLRENRFVEVAGPTGSGGTVNPTGVSDTNFATGMAPTGWFLPDAATWESLRIDGTEPMPPAPSPLPVPAFNARVNVPAPPPPRSDLRPIRVDFVCAVGDRVREGDTLGSVFFMSDQPFGDHDSVGVLSPASGTVLDLADPGVSPEPGGQLVGIGVRPRQATGAERNAVLMPVVDSSGFVGDIKEWHKSVGDEVGEGEPLLVIRFRNFIVDDEFDLTVPAPVSGIVLSIDRQVGQTVEPDLQLAVVGAPPQPPEGFLVELEYTIVSFTRPWWDERFLSAQDWTVPGFRRGGIASGTVFQTAESPLTLITTGMVAVRNLKITSHWRTDERDQLAAGALNLGPFSLAGADIDGETLSRPGVQALAWICQVPPILPPVGDPSTPPA